MASENNNFQSTVNSLFKGMDSFITTKTVVGDAITVGDTIILPLVDVTFGVAATAKNEDNTPVVKTGTAHISQFGEYDVTVNVTVTDDVITDIEVTGANFAGTYAETNKMMLEKAVNGLKGSYINKSATDVKEITGVDAVSGATYSSNAIRDAILNALELKQEEEVMF